MDFKIGEKYELEVIDICSNTSGYDYLLTLGPDDRSYKVHNIIKCQYSSIPPTIYGIVTGIDINGNARFKQDECRVLQEHYEIGKPYIFKISDYKKDNNDKGYYVLEDDFCYQRWYSNEELEIGDELVLEAEAIAKNGYITYARHKSVDTTEQEKDSGTIREKNSTSRPVFDGGDESDVIEYKTSIVFTPKGEADIDTQIVAIVRELAAFMNAKGGTLFIGIHDKTHEIVGIDEDLPHLCEGVSEYASSYTADYDHYELKIRNSLVSLCSAYAGSLINVSFHEQDNKTYCRIDAECAKRPVWMKGNMLFQRQGNQARMLRGEDITQFVGERIGSYIVNMAGVENTSGMSQENMTDLIHDAVKKAINDRRASIAATIQNTNPTEVKYWIVWMNNGTWVRQREKSDNPDVFKQLPVTDAAGDFVVVFCYASGTINTVKMKDFKKGANLGKIRSNGMRTIELPKDIFICHPSNLIAIYSADSGGTEYIKLHHISDVNPTTSGKNQGSYIIPKNKGHVLGFKLISPIQADRLQVLVAAKRDTTSSLGHVLEGVDIQKEVEYLNTI